MMQELEFVKYKNRGAYHWLQDSSHIFKGNAFVKARYKKCVELLKQEMDIKGKKVLDYGCGDGVLIYKIHKEGAIGYGIDPSEIAIKYAAKEHEKRHSNVKFSSIEGYKSGFDKNYFDAVICSDVIEHVNQPVSLLREIERILKPGGRAIISTPIKYTEAPLDEMHVFECFPLEFQALIGKVFHDAKYVQSHPLCWFELFSYSGKNRILINLLSLFKNPFLSDSFRWKYYSLQYAISKK